MLFKLSTSRLNLLHLTAFSIAINGPGSETFLLHFYCISNVTTITIIYLFFLVVHLIFPFLVNPKPKSILWPLPLDTRLILLRWLCQLIANTQLSGTSKGVTLTWTSHPYFFVQCVKEKKKKKAVLNEVCTMHIRSLYHKLFSLGKETTPVFYSHQGSRTDEFIHTY